MYKNQRLNSSELLDVLALCNSAFAVYTTENIVIEMANDAMIAFWGKDRSVIGKTLEEAIPELEGQPFIGLLKDVYKTGITNSGISVPAKLHVNGKLQTFYYDYEYRAIKNEKGETYCILHTSADVTDRVLGLEAIEIAEQQHQKLIKEQTLNEELAAINEELNATNEELEEAQESLHLLNAELEERVNERTKELSKNESRLRYMLADAPVAIAVLTGNDLVVESANKKILEAWGKTDAIIGKPLKEALPELVGQDFFNILNEVFISGNPYHGNEVKALLEQKGKIEEVYANFVYHPIKNEYGATTSIMIVANIVTEQVKANMAVEASEKRFRFMLNTLPQQVWTATPEGKLDYVNQIVCKYLNQTTNEVITNGWRKYIHPEDLDKALSNWLNSLQTGEEYQQEFRLLCEDGTYKWHLVRALPWINDDKIMLWVGTNTDIDTHKNNEQKKDEFISIASHELKTPLTSIKAYNQLIMRIKDNEKRDEFLHKSVEHINRLEKLINDLLDVTKINAGKINYTMQPFVFKEMLQESIKNVQHTFDTHQIILESSTDVEFTGDQFRLEQVMNNFLTNAVKYSPKADKVLVNCKIVHNNIVVSIQDFGIGIEENSLNKLFERYYRVDNTAMRFEGLGLGLFISSEILKRHKGNFWIDSKVGEGSTFYFSLPLVSNEKEEIIKTKTSYKDKTINVFYDEQNEWLEVDWTGFQTVASVKNGCAIMLEMIIANNVYKAINNNINILGNWSEAAEWVGTEFFPMLEKAGLKYGAWVYSDNAFNRLSAQKSVEFSQGEIICQFFTDLDLAREWLATKRDRNLNIKI
jgi:PAS domain S-box-containing protein